MNREDVENLKLIPGASVDIATGRPIRFKVEGLPAHLTATIDGIQSRYSFHLRWRGKTYEGSQGLGLPQPEQALEELKAFLLWAPPK